MVVTAPQMDDVHLADNGTSFSRMKNNDYSTNLRKEMHVNIQKKSIKTS